ncbi:hypothetical protein [Methylobacter sp.]|uniref:hypothetical protein n=1 Tax=Methylobacter sp. TaxID=2051955 RepID=UPI002FDE27E8
MKYLITQPSRAYRTLLLIISLFSLMIHQPALAHNGVDHNNSCFLTVGDTQLRISGYQFQPELEGKHFCHFFPELGQIALAVEPLEEKQGKTLVTLELAALTSWLNPSEAFTVIKQQPEQAIDTGLASISQTIRQRGIYRLNIMLKDDMGHQQQQRFVFLVGVPVTKILVMIAGGLLVLVIGFVGINALKAKVEDNN